MKKIVVIGSFFASLSAYAGGMLDIPVKLLDIENQGRVTFIQNALSETGMSNDNNVKHSHFRTIVIGGDEQGSDYTGGYFIFEAQLKSDRQNFRCLQYLSVGNFDPRLTRPIECKSTLNE